MATSPSQARRDALNQELSIPIVSNFFPIERYYEAADKVYAGFLLCSEKNKLDDAYVYGKRYCLFVLDAIPNHNYYGSPKYKRTQNHHTLQISKVIAILEGVVRRMDTEELEKQRREALRIQKEKEEAARKEMERFLELQKRAERQTQYCSSSELSTDQIEASAMSKLDLLRKLSEPSESTIRRDPSGEEPKGQPSSRYRLMEDDDDDEAMTDSLPPPLLPPAEEGHALPPSYHQVIETGHRAFLGPTAEPDEKSFLSASKFQAEDDVPSRPPPNKRRERIPMRELQHQYAQDYKHLLQKGSIKVMSLGTCQGRVAASTNGCTVISALIAAKHLNKEGSGISDREVDNIIDRDCGPLLKEIRGKLGLGGHALIIPSDVHDHLVDRKILHQEYFIGAAGGNILDHEHLGTLLDLLREGEDGDKAKVGATLFFREHVVSIIRGRRSSGALYYDLVDSLPTANGKGTRTRCDSFDALQVLVRYYASKKFSESHCSHVDRNRWDDSLADFDPRVFQGFVWAV